MKLPNLKAKIFAAETPERLEAQLNEFLKESPGIKHLNYQVDGYEKPFTILVFYISSK